MKKEAFLKAIDTLKLYRRAELLDDQGQQLVSKLYVDPLPENHVLHTLLRPNTTFLIGRKGTGKSTIFQRVQESLNSEAQSTWAYIDIKTLYEASISEVVGGVPTDVVNALSPEAVERLCVFRNFILELIREIKSQIKARITSTLWGQVREAFTGAASELFERLDEFVEELKSNQFLDVTARIQAAKQDEDTQKEKFKTGAEASTKIGPNPTINAKVLAEMIVDLEKKRSQNYSQVFIRIFNIRGLIARLRDILTTLNLKHLYIFIDDFSELPRSDMEQVVDTILAPLNNWSDEFIKLKVAVYPGRLYAGAIDLSSFRPETQVLMRAGGAAVGSIPRN